MRLAYLLFLTACIAIASCNALSASELQAAVGQNAQRLGSSHSVVAARDRGASGKRLLRSDNLPTVTNDVDAEERALPGITKLSELAKKGKSAVSTKLSDKMLWLKYQKLGKQKLSDLDITGMWLKSGKVRIRFSTAGFDSASHRSKQPKTC
ncbi:beta-glucosidase btgE [Phytophthora nicotianae]|uniref:RxLR effector protein n=1 Tax=Phytophthora nicotianae TaxID=4792 RepID=A0A0W8CD80_PHYNI|nr:hypothetical protein AM588_10000147 [Phytophthora nicotianae]KUF82017.1 beta-glucosidase btgE [Phytophthora nicotianae]